MDKFVAVTSLLGALIGAPLTVAHAQSACGPEIDKTYTEWKALGLTSSPKPTGMAHGVNGHAHITSGIATMRFHMARAKDLCKSGQDHEALLHLDVVRAFLKLSEIQHPANHHSN